MASPRPGEQWHSLKLQMSLTQRKALYAGHVNTAKKLSEIKEKHYIRQNPGGLGTRYNQV